MSDERMSDQFETPQAKCPRCGVWVDDLDGFGVLCHDACGYCEHPSINGGICGLCGDKVGDGPTYTIRPVVGWMRGPRSAWLEPLVIAGRRLGWTVNLKLRGPNPRDGSDTLDARTFSTVNVETARRECREWVQA